MSSKEIFTVDYASFVESEYLELERTSSMDKAKYIVNPKYSHLVNKIIIVNLPIDIAFPKLLRYNKIISRFPIAEGIGIEPYDLPSDRVERAQSEFSCLILNKEMLLNPKYLDIIANNNFLVGIDTVMDGFITLAGYIILKNKFTNLS
jgi:hypothetical protein